MVSDSTFTVEELLARSKSQADAARAGRAGAGASEVEKLLAGREDDVDSLNLSPVQKLLQRQQEEADRISNVESYFESEEFLRVKITQLRGELSFYSNFPGLDPDGSNIARIEQEISAIFEIQAAQQREIEEKAADAQAKQEEVAAASANALPSVDDLLARARGEEPAEELSDDVKALLENARNSVDISA